LVLPVSSKYFSSSSVRCRGSSDSPLPELTRRTIFLWRFSSCEAASNIPLPGKPTSSLVMITLGSFIMAIWLIAMFNEWRDLPEPPHTMQSAVLKSSYNGSRSFSTIFSMLSLINSMYSTPEIFRLIFFTFSFIHEETDVAETESSGTAN